MSCATSAENVLPASLELIVWFERTAKVVPAGI
jgi:hypothetical protein